MWKMISQLSNFWIHMHLSKKQILFLLFQIVTLQCIAQGRLILNNNVYLTVNGGGKIIIENPNPNAITTTGTGGNIISEDQQNQLHWIIGNATGTYTVPFTTKPTTLGGNSTKIPVEVQITGAGTGTGRFEFSTYETTTDLNMPYPMGVTHMNYGGSDVSLNTVDRFWRFNLDTYTTKPAATLSLTYDDAVNEIGGMNIIVEPVLRAQRWNPGVLSWEDLLFGTTNSVTNVTSGISVAGANFHDIWTLVYIANPLPVELVNFSVTCENGISTLHWTTISENNNDYFIVTRSGDGVNFEPIATVDGAGNSLNEMNYSHTDSEIRNQTVYYQLVQVDFDGSKSLSTVVSSQDCSKSEVKLHPNPAGNYVYLQFGGIEVRDIQLYDAQGRLIQSVTDYDQSAIIDVSNLLSGAYFFKIETVNGVEMLRFIKQ